MVTFQKLTLLSLFWNLPTKNSNSMLNPCPWFFVLVMFSMIFYFWVEYLEGFCCKIFIGNTSISVCWIASFATSFR